MQEKLDVPDEKEISQKLIYLLCALLFCLIFIVDLFTPLGVALFAIWVTAFITLQRKNMDEKRIEALRREQQILEDTKILRGLLPICASCKKIRDDKGYWNRIETYIESHSDAQFSHGLCQDCMAKLYGDQDWYKNRNKPRGSDQG